MFGEMFDIYQENYAKHVSTVYLFCGKQKKK